MALSAPSKLYADDVSLLVVLLDANPFFWAGANAATGANQPPNALSFSRFLSDVLPFLNSILLVNQRNHVVVIAAGVRSCGYVYDSGGGGGDGGRATDLCALLLRRLEEFVETDRKLCKEGERAAENASSLLSGSLSLALCYIQRVFRSGTIHPQPRILCLQGSPDGPEQYVAVMNAIFSAQRSMMVFATDLQSRSFLQLPKPAGVDFRASCFCHKKTIDRGYVCSVCLSIFCKPHKKCSTCGSDFKQASADSYSKADAKRKTPDA